MRKPIIAANWKMHKTVSEAWSFVNQLKPLLDGVAGVEVVICPPFPLLPAVGQALAGTGWALGAQNLHWEKQGAFTGEVSGPMLADLGCKYVVIGHSERRQFFGETDHSVNLKVKAAFANQLTPIVCVGERLDERQTGRTNEVVARQTEGALSGLKAAEVSRLVIAYEPVWAIGTGKAATPEDANEVSAYIRHVISGLCGKDSAEQVRIQYGGSVKPANIGDFMAQTEVDGALVGGASLEAESFAGIVKFGK